jgi:cell division septation protein DedD
VLRQAKQQMYISQSTRVMLRLQRIMAGQAVPKARIWQQQQLQQRL